MISPKKRLMMITSCPECGDDNLIEDSDLGEIICHNCGLVISENMINRGAEWRAFSKEESDKRGRVGMPTSFSIHDKGLSTVIAEVNRDVYGRTLSLDRRLKMLRLRQWQTSARYRKL